MRNEVDIPLVCPRCNSPLGAYKNIHVADAARGNRYGTVRCACLEYPVINGIVYCYGNDKRRRAIHYLKRGQFLRASVSVCDAERIIKLLVLVLLLPSPLNSLCKHIFNKYIYELLPIKLILLLFLLCSVKKQWWHYARTRESMPSYFMTLLASGFMRSRVGSYLDIGCGLGHTLAYLARNDSSINTTGLDVSFVSLLLARLCIVPAKTALVCADADRQLPFAASGFDIISANDTLHSVRNKSLFIKELYRIGTSASKVLLFHVYNPDKNHAAPWYVPPTDPASIVKLFRHNSFRFVIALPNAVLWKSLGNGQNIPLKSGDPWIIENALSYSLVVSKKPLPLFLSVHKDVSRLLNKTVIDYYQDPELAAPFDLQSIMERYSSFVFISPHLDDAVLSCGALLQLLRKLEKHILIVTLFTQEAPPSNTPQALEMLERCGFSNAHELFKIRKKEDLDAGSVLGFTAIHLPFIDAAWRKTPLSRYIPFVTHVYPSPQSQFSGLLSLWDVPLLASIGKTLRSEIKKHAGSKPLLVAPLGIGGHADHSVARKAVRRLSFDTLYWSDFPYNTDARLVNAYFLHHKPGLAFELKTGINQKVPIIQKYRSQMPLLFPDGEIVPMTEKFYRIND